MRKLLKGRLVRMTLKRDQPIFVPRVDDNGDLHITEQTQLHRFLDQPLSALAKSHSPGPVRVDFLVLLNFAFAH